jgi:3-hydroxymyristoyl/3-hydroxydecanoyl-(acyl carrier protein) dehydratase
LRLRSHDGIDDVRLAGEWVLVVPNERGARMLRRCGKAALVGQWLGWLRGVDSSATSRLRWRLVESLPEPGSADEVRSLQPIRQPVVHALDVASADSLRCQATVPLDLAVFEGHFPTLPVVPAVVQIGWVLDLARAHLGCRGRFGGVVTAKFRRLVRPGMRLSLSVDLEPTHRVRFEYASSGALVSMGRIQLVAADD